MASLPPHAIPPWLPSPWQVSQRDLHRQQSTPGGKDNSLLMRLTSRRSEELGTELVMAQVWTWDAYVCSHVGGSRGWGDRPSLPRERAPTREAWQINPLVTMAAAPGPPSALHSLGIVISGCELHLGSQ